MTPIRPAHRTPATSSGESPRARRRGSGGRPARAVSEQTSRRIVEAAKTLFLRDGYQATSMDALATAPGMSKRTLYARFAGKAELFRAVVQDVAEHHIDATEAIATHGRSLREQLLAVATQMVHAVLDPELVAIDRVGAGEARRFPELANLLSDFGHARVVGLVAGLLQRAPTGAGISDARALEDAEIFLSMALLPPLRQAVLGSGGHDDRARIARRLERQVDIFLQGISPPDASPPSRDDRLPQP